MDWAWTAHPLPGLEPSAEPPPRLIEGTRIRLMPEYGIEIPLWDGAGTVEEPEQIAHLGLCDQLVEELRTWQAEWDEVHGAAVGDDTVPVRPLPAGWSQGHRERGRALSERLGSEIDPAYEVRFHP